MRARRGALYGEGDAAARRRWAAGFRRCPPGGRFRIVELRRADHGAELGAFGAAGHGTAGARYRRGVRACRYCGFHVTRRDRMGQGLLARAAGGGPLVYFYICNGCLPHLYRDVGM